MLFFLQIESFKADWISGLLLLVHFALHATSFRLHLPAKRNYSEPMIWPEFRVHNAIFAYRNLLGAALGIYLPEWWLNDFSVFSMVVKLAVILLACKASEMASDIFGDKEKRTTNAMPYPAGTPQHVETLVKHFYMKSQFAATALAVYGGPVLAFGSVLAIEIASLLMTLVRKRFIRAIVYHIIYSASLFIMFPAMIVYVHFLDENAKMGVLRALISCAIALSLRMPEFQIPHVSKVLGHSKYMAWSLALPIAYAATSVICAVDCAMLVIWAGFFWSMFDTLRKFIHPAIMQNAA